MVGPIRILNFFFKFGNVIFFILFSKSPSQASRSYQMPSIYSKKSSSDSSDKGNSIYCTESLGRAKEQMCVSAPSEP